MGTTILLGIISIGVLIFVHESGHFLAARAVGIKVEVFSIGWGKGIFSFYWKDTKIQIGWIPFGGFCKMAGESPSDEITGVKGEYYSSSPIRRIAVAFSGPLFNYLFAAFLFIIIIIIGYEINTYSNKIVIAKKEDISFATGPTPAQKAGLKDGDIIVEINGKNINNWEDITGEIVRNALKPIKIDVLREGRIVEIKAIPELDDKTGRGIIGIYPWVEPIVREVVPADPADLAGIRSGDKIISVDGIGIKNHVDFYEAIKGKSYKNILVVIERDGLEKHVNLKPRKVNGYDTAGLYFKELKYKSPEYPLYTAIGKGFSKSAEVVKDTIRGIILLFSGKIKVKNAVAGPAKLIYISGTIAKEGIVYFFQVMSYISIAFFIMNLIPFPALDGSHIIISSYELFTRRKPNLKIIYKIQAFGFVVLMLVLVFVTINDISSFFSK